MKRDILILILGVLVALIAAAGNILAQNTNANTSAPAITQNEIMTENDRLPFMHSEDAASSEEPTSGGLLLKTLGSLLLIVGLIFFGAWGARKLGYGGERAADVGDVDLAVLSTVSLGKDRSISMVRFGERVLVVGSTPQSFTLLAEEMPAEKISMENHRSVADMLADEENLFADELARAEINGARGSGGGLFR
jgi:flagellar biogenesis protein FliO